MSMNKIKIILTAAAAALCVAAAAQTTADEFQARYERLVRNVGYSGVGVETLLDRWGEAFPDDMRVPVARFQYFYQKSLSTELTPMPGLRRFLGKAPTLTLKDPEGEDVPYFEEEFFDDDLFREALDVLNGQIAAHPDELRWRYLKIAALTSYEKDFPDMSGAELRNLIARDAKEHPAWTLDGAPASREDFQQGVGEFCAKFYETGSEECYELFRDISTLMNKYFPKNPVFIDNLGSYWLIARDNEKQAVKFYKKALKLDPDDYAAKRNLQLIERRQAAAQKK